MTQRTQIALLRGIFGVGAVVEQISRHCIDIVEMRQGSFSKTPRLVMIVAAGGTGREVTPGLRENAPFLLPRAKKHHCVALLPLTPSTTTVPVMCGCRVQKYSYAPGVVNVKEKLSAVSSVFDLKSFELETTVCGESSSLTQVTVLPGFTTIRFGEKAKPSISTCVSAACAGRQRKPAAAARIVAA